MDVAIKSILKGNFSPANTELETLKTLISKRIKLIRFADKPPAGWTPAEGNKSRMNWRRTQKTTKRFHQPNGVQWPRSAKLKAYETVMNAPTGQAPQAYASHQVNDVLSARPFGTCTSNQPVFVGSPFGNGDPKPSDITSYGQRGHRENSSSFFPSRLKGAIVAPPNSKQAN